MVRRFLVEREVVSPELAEYVAEKFSACTRDIRALARRCKTKEEVDIKMLIEYKAFGV